jgi:lipoprotein-anchoring transpeptidase ErfK/SrfK
MLFRNAPLVWFFAAVTLLAALPPAMADVVITIDKSAQRMTVAVDGATRWRWPVSTGARGYDTPNGSYTAFRMEKDYSSKEWDDAPMPNSIFFTQRGHAIHGSYDRRLGRPVSHGCVRLNLGNAAKLFSLVERTGVTNTKVVVTGRIH